MTYPWIAAVVTGLAAFVGAILAQGMQIARERAAWNREDRHRFAMNRQAAYADYSTAVERLIRAMEDFFYEEDRDRWPELTQTVTDARTALAGQFNTVVLLAPESVVRAAGLLPEKSREVMRRIRKLTPEQQREATITEILDPFGREFLSLVNLMRDDLGAPRINLN